MKQYRYDPLVTGVFVGIGLVGIWYFSCLAIEKRILPYYYEHVFRFLSILGGAFAAFRFNSMLENRKQVREKQKNTNAMLLAKMEAAIFKLHNFSRASKKYMWSIQRQGGKITRDNDAQSEARELIYEIEVYKKLYFPAMPLQASSLHAEVERGAGECDKHWMRVSQAEPPVIEERLEACKSVGNEVGKLDSLLEPIFDWCFELTETYKNE